MHRYRPGFRPHVVAGLIIFICCFFGQVASAAAAAARRPHVARVEKLDKALSQRAKRDPSGRTRAIVTLQPGAALPSNGPFRKLRKLGIINGYVVELPNRLLNELAAHPAIFRIIEDRPVASTNYRTAVSIGARAVQQVLGYNGSGVSVAALDSGIAFHDDLTPDAATSTVGVGNQRVAAFVDFVNGQLTPYDDNGHGTHVAGIIAGNGFDSGGEKAGLAPAANIVSLKVLDAEGSGTISNIIAALDWVLANKDAYNIRVVNVSAGAGIHESYWTDPLTLAAKRVVDAGVVVVAAAGNMGRNAAGDPQYGGITAPGNAPWVLTVGASSTMGTVDRTDDEVASYSSRGPTYLDWAAKPDLVAPGTGTVSLAAPGSTLFVTKADALLAGTAQTAFPPYLALTGTSMAAPVVSGTVALMLQANPALTPNAVKAILEYTAQRNLAYNGLTEGAGFLNTLGAVRLARFFGAAQPGDIVPVQAMWSRHLTWGNHVVSGGVVLPDANAWQLGVTWGATATDSGDNIVWGSACTDSCDDIVWGSGSGDNIVWGSASPNDIVWGSSDGQNDNIVWGSDCGGSDCDNIVWGSTGSDDIIWGSAMPTDNIVWGSAANADDIVWGSATVDSVMWEGFGGGGADTVVGPPVWIDPITGATWSPGQGELPAWLTDEQLINYVLDPTVGGGF
jgi:serine protease AprX